MMIMGRLGGLGSPLSKNPRYVGAVNLGATFLEGSLVSGCWLFDDPSSGMQQVVNRVRP